jgi:RecJ-like exonuclease
MLKSIELLSKEFLQISKEKPVRIIAHHDTDGITSAAILIQTLKRLDKKFSVRIVKGLDRQIIDQELKKNKNEVLFFTDLASNNIDSFQDIENPIFILDHHEINKDKLNSMIKIINPHLYDEENICGAALTYLFSKSLSEKNKDLSKLAIIGMIGDRHETNLSKIYQQILGDAEDLEIRKSLLIFSATRPLRKSLEYSTAFIIPGVTNSSAGVMDLLKETQIPSEKTLYELDEQEISRLVTSIMVRRAMKGEKDEIIGNIYLLKFFNRKEDVRELSVLINACSRLGYADVALLFCLQNEKAKEKAQEIYAQYKQELVSALGCADKMDTISGNGFVILNAKDKIKDTIIGTVTSILSSSLNYQAGTVLIGMAYNEDKIKVSARITGRTEKNLKQILERVVATFQAEVGGHQQAAGCLINKIDEERFVEELRKNLEIEVVKI